MRRDEIAARLAENVSKAPLKKEDEVENYYLDVKYPSSRQPPPRSVA